MPAGDLRNLRGRLSLAEDDLGNPWRAGAVVVDAREPDVLEWLLAQILKKPLLRRLRR